MKLVLSRLGAGALLGASLVAAPLATGASAPRTPAATCSVVGGTSWRLVSAATPCRVVVAVGGTVRVRLSSSLHWSAPRRSSGSVRVAATHPASGGLSATISARRVGRATVSATGGAICAPGQPCPTFAVLWSLRVQVVARPASPVTVSVTQAEAGRTFYLRVGDRFAVSLAGPASYTWTVPTVSDPTVLTRLSGGRGYATFRAVGPGTITVMAVDNPNCYPECLPPSRMVQFTVSVT